MLEKIIQSKLNLDRLEHTINAIENSIQADKTNVISPTLNTPKNFIESLEKINSQYHMKTMFEINLHNSHLVL